METQFCAAAEEEVIDGNQKSTHDGGNHESSSAPTDGKEVPSTGDGDGERDSSASNSGPRTTSTKEQVKTMVLSRLPSLPSSQGVR